MNSPSFLTPKVADQTDRPTSDRTCILVLGMHRSGTSAMTRLLSMAGAKLPTGLLGAGPGNEAGHWESSALIAYHDRMLHELGSDWSDWRALEFGQVASQRRRDIKAEIADLIASEYRDAHLFVVKEPRICRFAPLFMEALDEAGIGVRVVHMLRNPLEVAESLERRDGLPRSDSMLLWLRHVLDSEAATRGRKRALISYSNLLQDWRGVFDHLGELLRVPRWPYPADDIAPQAQAFLSSAHRHHVHTTEDVLLDPSIKDWAGEAYSALLVLEHNPGSKAAMLALDAIRREFDHAAPVLFALQAEVRGAAERQATDAKAAAEREIAKVKLAAERKIADVWAATEKRLAESEAAAHKQLVAAHDDLERHNEVLAAREREVSTLKSALDDAQALIQQSELALAEHQSQIGRLKEDVRLSQERAAGADATMTGRDEEVARLKVALSKAERVAANLKALAEGHEKELRSTEHKKAVLLRQAHLAQQELIEHFHSSTSWKVTRPLRWLKEVLLRIDAGTGSPARSSIPPAVRTASSDDSGCAPHPARSRDDVGGEAPPQTTSQQGAPKQQSTLPDLSAKTLLRAFFQAQLSLFLASKGEIRFPVHADPDVSVVLVLHNQAELTYACLRSLEHCSALSRLKLEVIVLDNASSDRTDELLTKVGGAKVVQSATNLHFLRGVNRATQEASGRYVLLLNNDALLMPGSLEAACSTLASADDVGVVGGRIVQMDGRLQEAGSMIWNDGSCLGYGRGDDPTRYEYSFRREVDYCSGAFILTPRALFEKLGRFDEAFAPAYYEETDYCMRVWKSGYRILYEPDAIVLHFEFGSAAAKDDAIALQSKNQARFRCKHQAELARHYASCVENILPARSHGKGRGRILLLDDRIPHRALGSGYPRANDILKTLAEVGYFTTHYPVMFPNDADFEPYLDVPKESELVGDGGAANLETFLEARRGFYDVVFVSRPHNMSLLNEILDRRPDLLGGARLVFDAEALFATRDMQKSALSGKPLSKRAAQALIDAETAVARNASCIVTVSEAEAAEYRKRGFEGVGVVGHRVVARPTASCYAERKDILFVGAIHDDDSPNADSVVWFAREVWPQLREELPPGTEFLVAGLNLSKRVAELSEPGVCFCGFVDDLEELYDRSRVFVAPTRFAAGIPYKAHEAAAHGLPIVCTSLIARQLDALESGAVRIADSPADYVQRVLELYEDEALWIKTRRLALAMVEECCSADSFTDSLLAAVQPDLPEDLNDDGR